MSQRASVFHSKKHCCFDSLLLCYTDIMSRRFFALFVLPLTLSACSSGSSTTVQTSAAPQSAAIALNLLMTGNTRGTDSERPVAVLGAYIASYLAHGPGTYTAAMRGAEIQAGLQEPAPTTEEVYLVLQQLGSVLQVNVPDIQPLDIPPSDAR